MRVSLALILPFVAACAMSTGFRDDAGAGDDGGSSDGSPATDGASEGGPTKDAGAGDGGGDASVGKDGGDGGAGDGGAGDGGPKDAGPPLLGPPCTHGPGWIAWKFHYNGSTSAITDVYALPDSSNWQAVPAYPNSASWADALHGGGINIASGNWILIRYSVVGLTQIKKATLSMYGRSYSTGSSGSFNAWSPIYGDAPSPTNSVSNAWPYAWTTIDFAGVQVGDQPGLTGIRFYAGPSSSNLIINTVELCIDGS
jgi:hypothetical protein